MPFLPIENTNVIKQLELIREKEPEAFEALSGIVEHIANTYGEKYQAQDVLWVDTKKLLTQSKDGKFSNLHSAGKYVQRYSTTGFDKSENPVDLRKAIHYLLFEIQRKKHIDGLKKSNENTKG